MPFQISPLWNVLTDQHLNKRIKRPIEKIDFEMTANFELKIGLNTNYVHHFGIEKWIRMGYSYVSSPVQSILDKTPTFEENGASIRLKRLFKLCSSIGKISILNMEPMMFKIICEALGGIPINTMTVRGQFYSHEIRYDLN